MMVQGNVQYSVSTNVEAHRSPRQRSLWHSLSDVQVAPNASSETHTLAVQRDPELHDPVHAWPGPGSAVQVPETHAPANGSQVSMVSLHAAPAGWRTTWTQTEFTQLAPADAPPDTAGSAHAEYVWHAPPGGMTPRQESSQLSISARSAAVLVAPQSARAMASRQRPAVDASHIAPAAAAWAPLVTRPAAMSASHAPMATPPED